MTTADALLRTLESTALPDANLEPANVVDVIGNLTNGAFAVANSIAPRLGDLETDDDGRVIGSLTDAVMSLASAIRDVARAISHVKE